MKILIAYVSNSGTSREGALLLESLLPNHEITVADLSDGFVSPEGFDYLVLGGPVRMSRAHRTLRRYCKQYEREILALPRTLYLCCAIADQFENYLDMSFSKAIIKGAEETLYFGGELDPSKQKGLDRIIVRMMRNSIRNSEDDEVVLPGFLPEHVRLLADRLRQK